MSIAYYNEHDEYAAEWLRNLIAAGHIAPGVVDSRDIRDIVPSDLEGFTQCHFFAGVGVWSLALRQAGWPDDRPIWTGSCPCQPFSAAGRAGGFADERHLWPHWHWLISQCRPPVVVGEQVASKDGLGWFDLVSADLEGTGYAVGALDLCAAGIGVEWQESQSGEWLRRAIHDCTDPVVRSMLCDFADWASAGNISEGGNHIRQRLYFVGLADCIGEQRPFGPTDDNDPRGRDEKSTAPAGFHGVGGLADPMPTGRPERGTSAGSGPTAGLRAAGGLENSQLPAKPRQRPVSRPHLSEQEATGLAGGRLADGLELSGRSDSGMLSGQATIGLVDTDRSGARAESGSDRETGEETTRGTRPDDGSALSQRTGGIGGLADSLGQRRLGRRAGEEGDQSGAVERPKRLCDAIGANAANRGRYAKDWLFCRDDKWRAAQSGSFPLAHGVTARVGKLRAFGNALDAETATRFCEVVKELLDD